MEKKTFSADLQTEENKPLFDYIAELESEIEVVEAVNQDLTTKVEELSAAKTIGEAGEKAQAKETPVLPSETFSVNGDKYKFTTPVFMYKGNRMVSSEVINDTALLSELVEKGIGVITKA